MDWITRIPPDVFDKAMAKEAALRYSGDERFGQFIRMAAMMDQKSSSMLTYLAILLAGVSILLVGGGEAGIAPGLMGVLLSIEFGMVFLAAFLFLSCARTVSFSVLVRGNVEESMEIMAQLLSGRYARFGVAFVLTVVASGLFAMLIAIRIAAQYFL